MLSRVSLVFENEVQMEFPGRVLVLADRKGSSVDLIICELVPKIKILDVCCCLVSLVQGSSAAELEFVPVEGLVTVMTKARVDDLLCTVTDTPFDGFFVVSTSKDVSETPGLTIKGVENGTCAKVRDCNRLPLPAVDAVSEVLVLDAFTENRNDSAVSEGVKGYVDTTNEEI